MEGRSQPLTVKDAQTFQLALSLYEKKEYEKCLAEVEQIMRRRKEQAHGESMCLKALALHHLKRDGEEVKRLMDEGTRVDARSAVAWHMSGIYHKLRKEYLPAYKAYLTSYRLNRDNGNVHQDLAMLAAHQRDYATLVEVRRHILGTRMSMRMAWTSLAVALYLAQDYAGVEQTVMLYDQITAIERSAKKKDAPKKKDAKAKDTKTKDAKTKDAKSKDTKTKDAKTKDNKNKETSPPAKGGSVQETLADDVETSEMMMLRSRALMQQHKYAAALEDLAANESRVLDKLAWQETRAAALAHVDPARGRDAYVQLLHRNPENLEYYRAVERLSPDLAKLYADLQDRFPRADLPWGRPLVVLSPDPTHTHYDAAYGDRLHEFVKNKLARGVPSTFKLVQALYGDAAKARVLGEVVGERLGLPTKTPLTVSEAVFLARHYAFTGEVQRGIAVLEQQSSEGADPDTQVDLQLALAELLQRAGAFQRAGEIWARVSEQLPGDRALNTGAATAMFRANNVAEGYRLAYKFPIWGKYAENDDEALKHVVAMESVNLLLHMAQAHHRRREHGLALKRARQVMQVFQVYSDEQYDFHYYGPRRATVRAYADMLAWEDTLFRHPAYQAALEIATAEWVAVARHESDGLSDKELAAAKRHRVAQLDKLDLSADPDPFGLAILEQKSALQTAYDDWKRLEQASPADLAHTWWLGFQILLAQKKYVLANQALKKAREFGLSASRLAAGGLMARHTLETDGDAPQVLRSVQLKMLPQVVSLGDVVNADPVEYANTFVTDLLDWIRVRRFIDAIDGVEAQVIERLATITDSAAVAEQAYLILQRVPGHSAKLADAIRQQWPLQSFVNAEAQA